MKQSTDRRSDSGTVDPCSTTTNGQHQCVAASSTSTSPLASVSFTSSDDNDGDNENDDDNNNDNDNIISNNNGKAIFTTNDNNNNNRNTNNTLIIGSDISMTNYPFIIKAIVFASRRRAQQETYTKPLLHFVVEGQREAVADEVSTTTTATTPTPLLSMTSNNNCTADCYSSSPPSDTTQCSDSTTSIAAAIIDDTTTTCTTVDANVNTDVDVDNATVHPNLLQRRKYIQNFKLHTMQDEILMALLKYPNSVGLYHKRFVTTTATYTTNNNNDSNNETTTTTSNGFSTNGNWIQTRMMMVGPIISVTMI